MDFKKRLGSFWEIIDSEDKELVREILEDAIPSNVADKVLKRYNDAVDKFNADLAQQMIIK